MMHKPPAAVSLRGSVVPSVLRWLVLVLQGDDSLFKSKFCAAYQAMSTIGYQFPADYAAVAPTFVLS